MREPIGTVEVDCAGDDFEEVITMDRRRFVKEVGVAALTVQCLPLIAHASGDPGADDAAADDSLVIRSSPGLMSHVHDLLVPYAVLEAPPLQGVELETTRAMLHRHTIALSREQLIVVHQGGAVSQRASSHVFVIALADGDRSRSTGQGARAGDPADGS